MLIKAKNTRGLKVSISKTQKSFTSNIETAMRDKLLTHEFVVTCPHCGNKTVITVAANHCKVCSQEIPLEFYNK